MENLLALGKVTIQLSEYKKLLKDARDLQILLFLLVQNMVRDDYHHGYSVYNIDKLIKPFEANFAVEEDEE